MPGLHGDYLNKLRVCAWRAGVSLAVLAAPALGALIQPPTSRGPVIGGPSASHASGHVGHEDAFSLRDFTAYMPPDAQSDGERPPSPPTIAGEPAAEPNAASLSSDAVDPARGVPLHIDPATPAAKNLLPQAIPPQSIAVVPEPSGVALVLTAGLALLRRRRRG